MWTNCTEPNGFVPVPTTGPRRIAGGITAHNDERRIERSIRSLLEQELPSHTEWSRIWVVASGCTDATAEIASSIAADEPRVRLLVEPERRGKAAAIGQVLRRAEGESLVLLNSDAEAAPGSVHALLSKAEGKPRPFAVMARPTIPGTIQGHWTSTMRWMWGLHHELHLEMLSEGHGAHLSDELLLVSLPPFPWIRDGIINDGSYCAVWLQQHAGGCWYAPDAAVSIEVPSTPSDHLRQRRRIHVGNAQVTAHLGGRPTTVLRYLFQEPARTLRVVHRALSEPGGVRHFGKIAGWEVVSHALAAWDRLPPRRDHVLWSRIARPAGAETGPVPAPVGAGDEPELDRRVRVLLEVAREFRTGVPVRQLMELLPASPAGGSPDLERFLAEHPALAAIARETAYSPTSPVRANPERAHRGDAYRRAAEALLEGPLAPLWSSIRCIGLTGSAAYGEPEAGDDLDFFVVTRRGEVPWFLAATYVAIRLHMLRFPDPTAPIPCFNYVIDDGRAPAELARGRGLLFAREALNARMLRGDEYYRGLLAQSPELARELPRLYGARTSQPGDTSSHPAPWPTRLLSALAYLPLAAFLQLIGLYRNAERRRSGRTSEVFRTLVVPDRVVFQSRRFEELRARYEGAGGPGASTAGVTGPSRMTNAR
jgi:Glycosyl transferase family 2